MIKDFDLTLYTKFKRLTEKENLRKPFPLSQSKLEDTI